MLGGFQTVRGKLKQVSDERCSDSHLGPYVAQSVSKCVILTGDKTCNIEMFLKDQFLVVNHGH